MPNRLHNSAAEWELLVVAADCRRQVRRVLGRFDRNMVLFPQPAAQIDQFAPLAAKGKRRVRGDRIIEVGYRLFADGAEHGAAFVRIHFADLLALAAEDDARLGSGAALGGGAGFESPDGFAAGSAAELPSVFDSFAGAAGATSAFAAVL